MVFKSAIDWWYWLVIVGIAVILVAISISAAKAGATGGIVIMGLALLFGLGLPLWLAFTTDYRVNPDFLFIRSGPFSWKIERSLIKSVAPSGSLLSSPALSLDRLEIKYGSNKSILVSPKDKGAFINALGMSPNV